MPTGPVLDQLRSSSEEEGQLARRRVGPGPSRLARSLARWPPDGPSRLVPVIAGRLRCHDVGADHTHDSFRHTQPSGVSAGRVRAPQVGQAVGAPSLISWVASAESWADPRRGRRAGVFFGVIVSPWFERIAHTAFHRGVNVARSRSLPGFAHLTASLHPPGSARYDRPRMRSRVT